MTGMTAADVAYYVQSTYPSRQGKARLVHRVQTQVRKPDGLTITTGCHMVMHTAKTARTFAVPPDHQPLCRCVF